MKKEEWSEIAYELGKSGGFGSVADMLRAQAASGSPQEIRELFQYLKDYSCRLETEWRDEFVNLLNIPETYLPELEPESQWAVRLHYLIENGTRNEVAEFLREIGIADWSIPAEADFEEPNFDIYPLDEPDEKNEMPISKALRLGKDDIANMLNEIRESIFQKYRTEWQVLFGGSEGVGGKTEGGA